MNLLYVLIIFIATSFFACKRCESFNDIAERAEKQYKEEYSKVKQQFIRKQPMLDSLINEHDTSGHVFLLTDFFSTAYLTDIIPILQKMGYEKIAVSAFNNQIPKAFYFYPYFDEQWAKNSCNSPITCCLIYSPIKVNLTDASEFSYKLKIYPLSDHLYLKVSLNTL
ncbi:MAG: hypothetical protein ABI480_04575 [Chitinophagaceae bacterium]